MRLKDTVQKQSSNIAGYWADGKDEYEQISEKYFLTNEQKLQYLHNLLSRNEHSFLKSV